jgi:putative glutathione S-transferase
MMWRMSDDSFSTSPEIDREGAFRRPASIFRETELVAVPGRYHLYVSYACPWAHRTLIGRLLKGLEDVIDVSVVDPIRDARGWRFSGGEYVDRAEGFEFIMEHYRATDPSFDARASVPVLWDTEEHRIVNNESGDILRMMSTGFGGLASDDVDLYPEPLRDEIDVLNEQIYETVNNAVYKAGFSRSQKIYEREVAGLFAMLDTLDERLASRRYLFGAEPVETDWRLFTTLVRFDAVYAIHFKCSRRRVVDYANLWPYVRDLYQSYPDVAATVRLDEIRRHYYYTHPQINPSRLIAVAPDIDFDAPHGRG